MIVYANYLERKARNEGINHELAKESTKEKNRTQRKEYRVCKKTNGKITNVI